MSEFPTLGKGSVGPVDWMDMNRLFRDGEAWEKFKRDWLPLFVKKHEKHFDQFWAKITDSSDQTLNHWRYAWEEVRLTGDAWATFTGARTGTTTTDYALNTCEASNDADAVEAPGTDVSRDDYTDTGFSMQEIKGNPVVLMRAFRDSTGAVRYAFTMGNDHDGPCVAP